MELINNRYRVIRIIEQTYQLTSYLVADLMRSHKLLCFNILNLDNMPDSVIDFFNRKFIALKALNNSSLINLVQYGVVTAIDNQKLKDCKYFYSTEYFDGYRDFQTVFNELGNDEKLDAFIQLCLAVNTLHIKGYAYGSLGPDNIYINKTDNMTLKLRDLATVYIEGYDFWKASTGEGYYKEPGLSKILKDAVLSDIHSLGMLLIKLFKLDACALSSNAGELAVTGELADYEYKLFDIAEKMIDRNPEKRYLHINQIIKDINHRFGTKYRSFYTEDVDKLLFDNEIVGREYPMMETLKCYNAMLKDHKGRIIGVYGETGVGKTRFLSEVRYVIQMAKARVYTSFITENANEGISSPVELMKMMISECDNNILVKYEQELMRFFPEVNGGRNLSVLSAMGQKERFRLINRLASFVSEFVKDKPTVIIVDNMHLISDFFLELLDYLFSNGIKNLLIVFSYDDSDYKINNKLTEMNRRFKEKQICSDIKLNPLSSEETVDMVRNILGTPHLPVKFAKRVYSQTYGNPLFIEEVLRNLYTRREIYVDSESGLWTADYNSIEDIPIPSNMEQAILSQIKDISHFGEELLNVISIFNDAVNISTISKVSGYETEVTEKLVNDLVKRGILAQKINDRGFVFEFYNKVLKRLVYGKLSEEEKRNKHKLAAVVLEDLLQKDDRDYREELIYHLEMAEDNNKVIKYCIENVDRFEKLNIREAVIRNIEKIIAMLSNKRPDDRFLEFLIRLGDNHRGEGNIETALENYEMAKDIALELGQYKYYVDSLNEIAHIYYDRNEIDKCSSLIEIIDDALLKVDYVEGALKAKLLWIMIMELKQEHEKALELCSEAISLCGEGHLRYKGRFLNVLGNIYIDTSRIDDAMKCFEESIRCYEKVNYVKGTLNPLNNIGVIYGDYYQNEEKAIEYFLKMKEISEKNNFHGSEISALVNLGETYFYQWKFDEALRWFGDALEIAEKYYYESLIFYSYNFISNIYLLLSDLKNAYKYFDYASRELLDHPDQGRTICEYYRVGASIFYEFGAIDRAHGFIVKALERHDSEESVSKWNCEILKYQIIISQSIEEDQLNDLINNIITVVDKFAKIENKATAIYDTVIKLYEAGHIGHAKALFKEFNGSVDEPRIQVKKLYIEGLLDESEDRIEVLKRALDLAAKGKSKIMYWKICSAIGDFYFSSKNYFYAVNFYFDACETIKALVLSIPEKYRVDFMNFHSLSYPFHMLYIVKQHYNKKYVNSSARVEKITEHRELERLFEYVSLRDILTNKYFIKSAQNIFDSLNGSEIRNIKDVVTNIFTEPVRNLEMIVKYLTRVTLAKTAYILSEENNRQIKILASMPDEGVAFKSNYIIDRVRASRESLLIVDKETGLDELHLRLDSTDVRAVICIPVIINRNEANMETLEERRSSIHESGELIGYIYLESNKILNNFNIDSLSQCEELSSFTGLIIRQHKLTISSSMDKLTSTFTRKFMEEMLDKQISETEAQERNLSIIIFDLDNFKGINDSYGHQTGDEVLKEVCGTILKNIRKLDCCGRYGGEEFVIMLPDTDLDGAEILAEKLRHKVESRAILGGKRPVTVSMGVASYPIHGITSQELIEKADQALYVAKENGRNRVQVWKREFTGKVKGTDKLTGVISGNAVQDYRNVSVIVELMDLIKKESSFEQKAYELLGRIIEITEAQQGTLFIIRDNETTERFTRRIFQEEWITEAVFNKNILKKVMESKQGVYMIDWDEITEYDPITGMPDWKSIVVVPLINSGKVKGLLYLSVPTKAKEFRLEDFNFINVLGQIAVALI